MRVIILSDTHGYKKTMDKIVPLIRDSIDLIVHAGDHFKDSVYISENSGKPVMSVVGNCDFDNVEDELVFDVEGVTFFLTHGHKHHVKYDFEFIADYAKSKGAQVAIFGHTHVKTNEIISGVQLINPGSLSMPRDGIDGSYVIMDINDGKYSFEYSKVNILRII